ncbi:hypothetical protein F511_32656 [Dorcoceras hygrometricum]|uniref:Uncharacterized protein n=1 Tax=Dorcoceras hygrometricum TaxID=472368 RepID=A0A2Z7C1D1_9LAMI|nr:hypothetical protein F511_32656 [Dorcoceras hygrometricum]
MNSSQRGLSRKTMENISAHTQIRNNHSHASNTPLTKSKRRRWPLKQISTTDPCAKEQIYKSGSSALTLTDVELAEQISALASQANTKPNRIGYPCTRASGESSTTKHRLLHASGPHPILPPDDPNGIGKRVKEILACDARNVAYFESSQEFGNFRMALVVWS